MLQHVAVYGSLRAHATICFAVKQRNVFSCPSRSSAAMAAIAPAESRADQMARAPYIIDLVVYVRARTYSPVFRDGGAF